MKLFPGKRTGMIYTSDITLDDIRAVFFPKNFYEKYRYLGAIPDRETMDEIKALVILMDYEAKPKYCPRWFLRFLHLFGSDNSIVRVRNRTLHNLSRKLTKGIMMWDFKTKWAWYDLRISIAAPEYIENISDAIERHVYNTGYKKDLLKKIKLKQPEFDKNYLTIKELENYLRKLEK